MFKIVKLLFICLFFSGLIACGGASDAKEDNSGTSSQASAIDKIKNYAQNGGTAPTKEVYQAAGITGLDAINLTTLNSYIEALEGGDVDTLAEIQAIVNMLASGNNLAPIANAKVTPSTVTKGDEVKFDGSQSKDVDGSISSYQWNEGTTMLSSQTSFTKSDFSLGQHTVTLTVTDNSGATNSANVEVTVNMGHLIKKTGQSTSYDENGDIDNNLKDDGFYKKGVAPNYSRDNTSNIVTDQITGLDWQDDDAVNTVRKPWLLDANFDLCESSNYTAAACLDTAGDTAATYCKNLSLGGHSNWRVPSARELEGIVDYSRYPPVDSSIFKNAPQSFYWSSTTRKVPTKHASAWTVGFAEGNLHNGKKSSGHVVRCVRYSD